MAFKKNLKRSKIQLLLRNGVDGKGNPAFKTVTYANVVEAASDEDIQAVGAGLGSLQNLEVAEVIRLDEQVLINE